MVHGKAAFKRVSGDACKAIGLACQVCLFLVVGAGFIRCIFPDSAIRERRVTTARKGAPPLSEVEIYIGFSVECFVEAISSCF